MTAQIAGRPIGVMMGIGTALNPFTVRPSYKQLESLPIAEQRKRLRDPEVRRQILAEQPSDAEVAKLAQFRQAVVSRWDKFFVMDDPPDYEPAPEKSVAAIAARERTSARRGRLRLHHRGRRPVPLLSGGELRHWRPCADPRDDERSGLPARAERRRRALHLDRRFRAAELHAGALGPRPAARAASAARVSGQAPDQRDRRFLRFDRSRPSRAGPARRRQPDRFRRAAARTSPNSFTTCRPAAAASCSASTAMWRRSSPGNRSSSAASTPAPCPAASCAPAATAWASRATQGRQIGRSAPLRFPGPDHRPARPRPRSVDPECSNKSSIARPCGQARPP